MGKTQEVKERTQKIADNMKERMDYLIEKAFNTGAFDIDFAHEYGTIIPRAIVVAAMKTIIDDELTNNAVKKEANNIYSFL